MKFTKEEAEIAKKMGKQLYDLSNCARREGLLALDDKIAELPTDTKSELFLVELLKLTIDGMDGCFVRYFGENLIANSELTESEVTLFSLVLDGVLSIQMGDNPRVLLQKLSTFFGIEGCMEFFNSLVNV